MTNRVTEPIAKKRIPAFTSRSHLIGSAPRGQQLMRQTNGFPWAFEVGISRGVKKLPQRTPPTFQHLPVPGIIAKYTLTP